MNNRPSSLRVFGSSLVGNPYTYPIKDYVYRGDQPLSAEPKKTRPSSPPCSKDDCPEPSRSVGLCEKHYSAYKRDIKRDPSLKKPPRVRGFSDDACGTNRGYERHLYWKVDVCDRCRAAALAYRAERKAAKKREAGNASNGS